MYGRSENHGEVRQALQEQAIYHCRSYWFVGLLSALSGDVTYRDYAYGEALRCSPSFVKMVHHSVPKNETLASLANEVQPAEAESWFWLASFYRKRDREQAIYLYRRGLAIDPTDGLRWRILGDLLKKSDLAAAQEAYLQSCRNGDPGTHGCVKAAQIAEQEGRLEEAIRIYRLSNFVRARNRANELEQLLSSRPPAARPR